MVFYQVPFLNGVLFKTFTLCHLYLEIKLEICNLSFGVFIFSERYLTRFIRFNKPFLNSWYTSLVALDSHM